MRVLTFLHSFEPGGVERDALRLNAAWAAHGLDVQIALGRADGRLADEAPALPYHVFQTGGLSTRNFETPYMIARLPALIRRLRPDVVFCAGNTYSIVAVAMRRILGAACPPIVLKVSNDLERRDLPGWQRSGYHAWLRTQAPVFDRIMAMTDGAAIEIATYMHVPPARIAVVPNPSIRDAEIDQLRAVRVATTRAPGRRFLGVGRLAAQKNFALLVDAFARIARPDDHLEIVGEGPERGAIAARAAALGVTTQVTLPGHLQPLDAVFARADAFVLSSDYEGLGVVLIEALAAGVPIVATDCSTSMRALLDGVGRVVPPRDVAALAHAMEQVCGDRPDPDTTLARARAFSVEAVVERSIAVLAAAARL